MVDNFNAIKELLKFDSDDDFYHCQIIKRKKEHEDLGSNSYIVKTYYISSLEQLEFYKGEMVCLATYHNARVCINLNKRSFERIAFHNLKKVTDQIMNKDFRSVKNSFNSVCGTHSNESSKKWILDCDFQETQGFVSSLTTKLFDLQPLGHKYIATLPTKNGFHIIVSPFNIQEAVQQKLLENIDLHKDNPTILFIP